MAVVVGGVLLALLSFFGTILAIEVTHRTGPLALGPTAFLLGPGKDGPVNVIQGPGAHTVVHSVFFQNGSRELSREGYQNLMLLRAQLACGTPEVKVTSWVSSRKYFNDPEQTKNLLLASGRAEEVERQLAIPNIKITFARKKWTSFKEILDQHWFTELDDMGRPLPTMESLNRRVDIEIAAPCRGGIRAQ